MEVSHIGRLLALGVGAMWGGIPPGLSALGQLRPALGRGCRFGTSLHPLLGIGIDRALLLIQRELHGLLASFTLIRDSCDSEAGLGKDPLPA